MKKLLIALTLSTLMLSGCGLFRSGHAWKQAKQENPLQIPPGLDHPSVTAAVSIPPPSNQPATPQASANQSAPLAANATSMHMQGDVDTVYKRVGLVLQSGSLGTVTAHNATTHTYQLSIQTKPKLGSSKSFLQKHFSNLNHSKSGASNGASGSASGTGQGTVSVTLKVAPAKTGGSIVSARGNPQQAVHVISVLNSRLGA